MSIVKKIKKNGADFSAPKGGKYEITKKESHRKDFLL